MSTLAEVQAALLRDPTSPQSWQDYAAVSDAAVAPLLELVELDRRIVAKDPDAWRERKLARKALREAWQLSEADGVHGDFEGGIFKVWGVKRQHAACLERLSRVPLLDAHSLELNALHGAELPACLVALEALRPQRLLQRIAARLTNACSPSPGAAPA